VLAAGALPRPFPTISLGEVFLSPTSMVYRNLMAMDTEEMVRLSDARMSGTAFGTIIRHVSPEAGIGAPLAAVALHWRR